MAILPGHSDPALFGRGSVFVAMRLTHLDPTGTYTLPVPAGCLVKGVTAVVTEAFNATGAAILVGDGDDADGFLDSTDIAPATAATATAPAVKLSRDSSNPYATGKRYAVADTIDVALTKGTTGTTGAIDIIAELVNLNNLGLPKGAASTATP